MFFCDSEITHAFTYHTWKWCILSEVKRTEVHHHFKRDRLIVVY